MKRFLLLFLGLLCWFHLSAQEAPSPIYVAPDAPEWMRMMLTNNPNVQAIQNAYDSYYESHVFEKNSYTNYYKRWMHWARPFVQSDGSIHLPSQEETDKLEKIRRQQRLFNAQAEQTPWAFMGPVSTWDTDANPKVTWQTNVYSIDIAPSDPNTLYAGGENGGVWKTTDKGLNWMPLTYSLSHSAFTAVKIHPTDPNTAYAGTSGKIIKTSDGGASWSTVYSVSGISVREMAINPINPDIVLAGTNQGLLRSTNAGASWTTLFTNDTWTIKNKPGASDTYFLIRDNGSGSDFMRSTDDGATWTAYNTGWWTPGSGEAVTGAILAVCPSKPTILYAYECGSGTNLSGYIGVFISTDGGNTWSNTNPSNAIGNSPTAYSVPSHTNLMASNGTTGLQQGFYDMAIVVNPNNENQLIAGGTSWYKSTDGGATWTGLGGYQSGLSWSHPDIQWLAATGSDLWIASDGGINYSTDFGASIEARMNGVSGSDLWGFGTGWNEDILVGGRYHNGNMAWHESFPAGQFYRLGGGEAASGYVSPGPERKVYHSDISGKGIIPGFGNGVTNFSVGLFPNESYAYYANSEMVWHPQCWNTVFIGDDNILWKSTDGGASYAALYTFPGDATNKVYEIEIARSNPQVMYVSQWDGTDDKLWKSTNGGTSFTPITPLPLPNNNDRVKMALSAENSDILWVAVSYGSNGKKIYKTTDGGISWTNLSTSTLNGVTITDVMAQYGTDGGVYLGTNVGVFYRNNSHSDWQAFSTGLPYSAETNRIRPFYRDGKIRNGTWGFGVWESPFYEASTDVAVQAMANKLVADCSRDTFYFDDYSPVLHAGASWSWAFSGTPQYIADANTRTPKVVFGAAGNFDAIMTLSTPLGTFKDTLHLLVNNGCEMDSLPGSALQLNGTTDYAVVNDLFNITTDSFTVSAWIKPNGAQNDWAAIVFSRNPNALFGISVRNTYEVDYHWNEGGYGWHSGLFVQPDEWSHIALVVTPSSRKVYVNGVAATNTTSSSPVTLDAPVMLGYDTNSSARRFKGQIEEVCMYNRGLSQDQIREVMHLTRTHTQPNNYKLIAYYQFNESSGRILDRVGTRHAALVGSATRIASTCPVGPGASARLTVNSNGPQVFPNTGLTLGFPASGTYPNGELCTTRINLQPDQSPAGAAVVSQAYWVVHNFGTNQSFSTLDSISFDKIGSVPMGAIPSEFQLYKRASNADGNTWGNAIDAADRLAHIPNGSATFSTGNGIGSFSQFVLSGPSGALPVELLDFNAELLSDQTVRLRWNTQSESNADYFQIERSGDALFFEQIGKVKALGNSNSLLGYSAIDAKPLFGINYYRLRTLDIDGSSMLSNIRSVDVQTTVPEIRIAPNPVFSGQLLQIDCSSQEEVQFRLFDEKGQAVRLLHFSESTQMSTEGLPAGVYMYRAVNSRFMRFGKVVVK